jgi:hypothetical protein
MPVVDARELSRNYPVPYAGEGETPSNNLDDDMKRLALALAAIGIDVAALFSGVAGKADSDHTHAMSAIAGLVDALAGKAPSSHTHSLNSLSNVSVAGATAYQVLALIAGVWQPWAVDLSHVTGSGILRVDQPQTLTAGEKAQACANIGAAVLASPAFTGTPTTPTVSTAADSLGIVNVTALRAAISALVASSPSTLDTLNELAAALGNDPSFATTVATQLGLKVPTSRQVIAGGLATGGGALTANVTITVPKAAAADLRGGTNDTKAITPLTVADAMAWVALADASSIAIDHVAGVNRYVTLAGTRAVASPTNAKPGWPLNVRVKQDSTGGRSLTWDAAFDFGDGGAPVLSTPAGAEDLVSFMCLGTGKFAYLGIRRGVD